MTHLNYFYENLRKILFLVVLTFVFFILFGIFNLKSTSFQSIHTPYKTIIAMRPIHSPGDPVYLKPLNHQNHHPIAAPKATGYNHTYTNNAQNMYYPKTGQYHNNYVQQPLRYVSQPILSKRLASNAPMAIIPNYIQQKKTFYRPYIQTVNGYINPKSRHTPSYNVAFQANIPQNHNSTMRHLRPTYKATTAPQGRTVYTLPVYQEFASIKR